MGESKVVLPKRSRRFGVGKEIGGAVYLHRAYEKLLGEPVVQARCRIPSDFFYTIIKYHLRTGAVSFIVSPDFDPSPEPVVGEIWFVPAQGEPRQFRSPADPYIYHHKWLMVADDYAGFDVRESKHRSIQWLGLADLDRSRIGKRSYWMKVAVPKITEMSLRNSVT